MKIYRTVPDSLICDCCPPCNTAEHGIYMDLLHDSPAESIINVIKCSMSCPVRCNLKDGCPVCRSAIMNYGGLARCVCGACIIMACASDTVFGFSISRKTYDDLKNSGMIQTDDDDII